MKASRPGAGKEWLLTAAAAAVFAAATIALAPFLTRNLLFLAALPFAGAVFIMLVLNLRAAFVFIVLTRALLDLPLMHTKVGGGAGIGGVLNLFVILMAAFLWIRYPKALTVNRYTLPWFVFLGVGLLTLIYSPARSEGIRLLLNLTTYFCMFAAPFFLINSARDKQFWLRILLFSSFLPALIANLGLVSGADLFNDRHGRLNGTFAHPNILAFYLAFCVTLVFYLLRTDPFKLKFAHRFLLWIFLVDLCVLLVATQTRSAWMACAAFFVLYAFLKEKKTLIVCVAAALILTATPPVQSRLKDLTQGTGARRSEKLNSMAWRMKLWESALPMVAKRPVTGYGLESFLPLSPTFFPLEKKFLSPAHNVYVQLLFETGLLGLLAYLWIYLSLLKTFFARIRASAYAVSAGSAMLFSYVVGYLLTDASDNMLHYLSFNWYFWFFTGLMIRADGLTEREPGAPAVPASS